MRPTRRCGVPKLDQSRPSVDYKLPPEGVLGQFVFDKKQFRLTSDEPRCVSWSFLLRCLPSIPSFYPSGKDRLFRFYGCFSKVTLHFIYFSRIVPNKKKEQEIIKKISKSLEEGVGGKFLGTCLYCGNGGLGSTVDDQRTSREKQLTSNRGLRFQNKGRGLV